MIEYPTIVDVDPKEESVQTLSRFTTIAIHGVRPAAEVVLRFYPGPTSYFRVSKCYQPIMTDSGDIFCPESDIHEFGDTELAQQYFYALFDFDLEQRAALIAEPLCEKLQTFTPSSTAEDAANRAKMISPDIYRAKLERELARRHAASQTGTEFEDDAKMRYSAL